MERKDVDMEPLPKYYKIVLEEEDYEIQGTTEDPIEISSEDENEEN